MALTGALADLGVVDLLQLPQARRKTGELVVEDGQQEARLYYEKGKLVHAALGGLRGPPVLVHLLGWDDGRFEFRGEVAAPETSIDVDLQHAVMDALKTRDEQNEERRKVEREAAARRDERLSQALDSFVSSNPWALHACAMGPDGVLVAEARREDGAPSPLGPLRSLLEAWPRAGLRRTLLEDDLGTVAVVRLPDGKTLVVAAARGVALGAVSMTVGKLASSLES
jgi:hypothetical protein